MTRNHLIALLSATSLAGLPMMATAQTNAPTADETDEIVVTGSRIAVDAATQAASPVVSIGAVDIKTSGQTDITALLRESPALQGSLPGTFSAFNGGALGVGQLNLRGLGTERTLVLENGRRHVAGVQGTGAVDVNTISTALLDRVDILTGGASSIYGSDAVTGVVNFILRDGGSFDGLELRAQTGISGDWDAEEVLVSLATGTEFASGRGDIVFAAEYNSTESVTADRRDFAGSGLASFVANGPALSAALGISEDFANTFVTNRTLPISSEFGVIALGTADAPPSAFGYVAGSGGVPGCGIEIGDAAFAGCQVFRDGQLRPYNPGQVFINAFEAIGGDAVPADPDIEIILPEVERFVMNVNTSYDLADTVTFFADAKYAFSSTVESNQVNGFNDDIPIALDNPFIPAALRSQIDTLIAEGEEPLLVVSRDVLDINALPRPTAERATFRAVTGFTGEIDSLGIDWELSYNYGRTDADITNSRTRLEDRFFAAIDAVVDPATGEVVCRSDIADDPSIPGPDFPAIDGEFQTFAPGDGQCVPINILGGNSITAEAADFSFVPTVSSNRVVQQVFLATIVGDTEAFFDLPAGPIGYAFGFEYREEESEFLPDGFVQGGLTFGSNNSGPTFPSGGDFDVSEWFGEVNVPLLADAPFAEYLELKGAVRFADYSTAGNTTAWSVGGRYQPVNSLTLRATLSQAVRAPNINELFSPLQPATLGATQDPCNPQFINAGSEFREQNCLMFVDEGFDSANFNSAFVPGQAGGNVDLDVETADTFTVGAVWEPGDEFGGSLDGLQVIVDYYDIEIEGLITTLGAFDIAQNCVDAATINNQFCAQIDRDPTDGNITGFTSGEINLGAARTSGIDWTVRYTLDTPALFGGISDGTLALSTLGTHFIDNEEVRDPLEPDVVTNVQGQFERPDWIINLNADWNVGQVNLGWRGRYEGSQLAPGIENEDLEGENGAFFSSITRTGDAFINDFSLGYDVRDNFEIYAGLNNAFNVEPFIGSLSRPAGPRGRFVFIGVNAEF